MKRGITITILILGITAIFSSQLFWLNKMYATYKNNISQKLSTKYALAIEQELAMRSSAKFEGKKISFTSKEEIPSEELHKFKGDTIVIEKAANKRIGNSYSEILSQVIQDLYISKKAYINLHKLDSIYSHMLTEEGIQTHHLFTLYNSINNNVISCSGDSTTFEVSKNTFLEYRPIGTSGSQTLLMKVEIPKNLILNQMRNSIVISGLAMIIVLGCLFYQLFVIRKKDKLLRQRERATNGTIHDLKSPLAGVYTLLSLLIEKHKEDKKEAELLQKGKILIKRLSDNIESLLCTAKSEKQSVVLQYTEIDIPQMLQEISEDIEINFPGKQFSIYIHNQLTNNLILADAMYIRNVFTNLIENALKYSDEPMEVNITLTNSLDKMQFAIKDNGWGIPKKAQKKIFTQFYQVPRETMKRGYGIGLAHSQEIIKQHKGKIHFTSKENEGTTFYITLPFRKST